MTDRFRPDASLRRVTTPEARGKLGPRFVGTGEARTFVPSDDALGRFGAGMLASELNKDRSGRHGTEVA